MTDEHFRFVKNDLTVILRCAQFIRQGIDLWVNIPMAMNVGMAVNILEQYEGMDPSDEVYDEEEKEVSE